MLLQVRDSRKVPLGRALDVGRLVAGAATQDDGAGVLILEHIRVLPNIPD